MRNLIFFMLCLVYGTSISQVYPYSDSALNAQEQYKIEEYENALITYERAKTLQNSIKMSASERSKLDVELGQTAYRLQDYAKALEHFQNAVEVESNDMKRSALLRNLGNTAMQLKKTDKAIDFYKEGVKLNQNDSELKYNLSQSLRQKAKEITSKNQNNKKKNQVGVDKEIQSKSNEQNKPENQKEVYSFEDEQRLKILNDLLKKEAETKRRIEKKQSTPSTNSKDW
jgi:tetratricopeptide (TPR) repeat protein